MGMHEGWESSFSLHSHLPRTQLTEEWELYHYLSLLARTSVGMSRVVQGTANPCLSMLWSGILTA